jgi:hypothetical protein
MLRASHARPFSDRLRAARSAAPRRAPRTGPAIAALLALSGTAACNESRAPFSVEIVSPAGTDPVTGAGSGRLRVLVAQDGQPTRDQGVDLVGGAFQLDVTIASYVLPTRLGVELVRDGVTAIGAVPSFLAIGFPFVRVPVVPRGTCATLGTQRLATPRSGAALVHADAIALIVGGLDGASSPAATGERFTPQLLTASQGSIASLTADLSVGRARAQRIAPSAPPSGAPRRSSVLVLAAARSFFLDMTSGVGVPTTAALHAGAGERSGLVDLAGNGVAVVGGSRDTAGVPTVSWVALDQTISQSMLPDARRDAAASPWSNAEGVLVAGGNEAGASTFLFVPTTAARREDVEAFGPDAAPSRVLSSGVLVRSPDGTAALYVGALDEGGEVTNETFVVTGCPARCAVSAGPTWPRPRTGFAFAQTASAGWLVGGRDADGPVADVDRVTWSGTTPSFVAGALVTPREDASIAPLAGGLVLVVGGRSADRALEDFELCAPDALDTI